MTSQENTTKYSNYRWLRVFPQVLFQTWKLKIKNRNLNNDRDYIKHQKEFFKMPLLHDDSDKFDSLRTQIAAYVYCSGKNKTVLELGTGHGYGAVALEEIGFSKVVALDLVPERIKECQRQFPKSKVKFMVGDASKLPFKDKTFDSCVISFALHDMPKRVKYMTINEMIRVTRNTLVFAEPRTFKNPINSFFYGLGASIVDESLNIAEYVADDFDNYLINRGLIIVKNCFVWHNTLNIKVCQLN